jgi:hypothetical protein
MSGAIIRCIPYFNRLVAVGCDGKCNKAWGNNARPSVSLSEDPDDFAWLSDDELEEAPVDPGIYEGGDAKPIEDAEKMNKWCVRECERSSMAFQTNGVVHLTDFSQRVYNKPPHHREKT